MNYKVYQGDELKQTVTSKTAVINGLQPNRTYYFSVEPDNTQTVGGRTRCTHIAYANMKYVALEKSSFTLSERSTVRFGKDDKWVYKTFDAGTYTANSTTFGKDPYEGVVKRAEVVSDFYIGGGTNLLTGTGNHTVTGRYTSGFISNETADDMLTLFKGLEEQTVTVSCDYEYSGFIAGSGKNRLGWEIKIVADTTTYPSVWYYPDNDSGSGRISSTFVVPKNITGIVYALGYTQFYGSGTGTLSHLKIEKGSVATPWSPAPSEAHPVYMGTYTDLTQGGSTNPSDYTWIPIQDGDATRDGTKETISVTTRGIRFNIPKTLTVGSTITLRYEEYPLGIVPIGKEQSGYFGGGNKQNLSAKVISTANGRSVVEVAGHVIEVGDRVTPYASFVDGYTFNSQPDGTFALFSEHKALYY